MLSLAWQVSDELQMGLKRKSVTLTHAGGESLRIIFSVTQADPEVVYAIKTVYQPQFEQAPQQWQGREIREPYEAAIARLVYRLLKRYGTLALGLTMICMIAWLQLRNRGNPPKQCRASNKM